MANNYDKYENYDIALIAAVSENSVIGKDGDIPWRIKRDLERFSEVTKGSKVIMGRKTYESIPSKHRPLPGRDNLVLSRTMNSENGISVFKSIDDILEYVGDSKAYVIGGENVYRDFIPYSNELDITRVHRIVNGDTFFPAIDKSIWNLVSEEFAEEFGKDYYESFSFLRYVRR